jgi:ribosomal protein S14
MVCWSAHRRTLKRLTRGEKGVGLISIAASLRECNKLAPWFYINESFAGSTSRPTAAAGRSNFLTVRVYFVSVGQSQQPKEARVMTKRATRSAATGSPSGSKARKLKLSRETLRDLTATRGAAEVQGGMQRDTRYDIDSDCRCTFSTCKQNGC